MIEKDPVDVFPLYHSLFNCPMMHLSTLQYAPAVEGRCASGYVGLKNGGATCYMNSVLQQLFLVQGVPEDILAVCNDDQDEDR